MNDVLRQIRAEQVRKQLAHCPGARKSACRDGYLVREPWYRCPACFEARSYLTVLEATP